MVSLTSNKSLKRSLIFTHDKLVPLVICMIGATIQVTTLLAMYFSFPTSTIIDLYSPRVIGLPSISACYFYTINETDIENVAINRVKSKQLNSPKLNKWDLTLEELDNLTIGVNDFVVSCLVANSSLDSIEAHSMVKCSNVAPVQVHINSFIKCFTFFAGMSPTYKYDRNGFQDEYFLNLRLNVNYSSRSLVMLFVHENDEKVTFNNGSPEMVLLSCSHYNNFVLTYHAKTNQIAGPPYSKCLNYNKVYKSSKNNIIQNCMYSMIYSEHHALHSRFLARIPNKQSNLTFAPQIKLTKYRSECEDKFEREECEARFFEMKVVLSSAFQTTQPELINVRFAYPLGLQSNITITRKLDEIEYFCYVASVISLWLEVSLLSVAKFLFTHVRQICRTIFKRYRKQHQTSYENRANKEFDVKRIKQKPGAWSNDPLNYNEYNYPKHQITLRHRYPLPSYYY